MQNFFHNNKYISTFNQLHIVLPSGYSSIAHWLEERDSSQMTPAKFWPTHRWKSFFLSGNLKFCEIFDECYGLFLATNSGIYKHCLVLMYFEIWRTFLLLFGKSIFLKCCQRYEFKINKTNLQRKGETNQHSHIKNN